MGSLYEPVSFINEMLVCGPCFQLIPCAAWKTADDLEDVWLVDESIIELGEKQLQLWKYLR